MVNNIISIVQANIKIARKEANLTLDQLAAIIGVSHNVTIARYENGERKPDIETLFKISEATSKPIEWFFYEPEEKTIKQKEFNEEEKALLNKINKLSPDEQNSMLEFLDFLLWKQQNKKA